MIELHKKYIHWFQEKFNISNYGVVWIAFFKGVILTMLIDFLFF